MCICVCVCVCVCVYLGVCPYVRSSELSTGFCQGRNKSLVSSAAGPPKLYQWLRDTPPFYPYANLGQDRKPRMAYNKLCCWDSGRELSELGVVSCPWRTLFLGIGGVFRHLVVPLCISFQKNLSLRQLGLGKASDRGPLLEGHPGL